MPSSVQSSPQSAAGTGKGWVAQQNGQFAHWCGPGWPRDLDREHREALKRAGWTWQQWAEALREAPTVDDWKVLRNDAATVAAAVNGADFIEVRRFQQVLIGKGESVDERLAEAVQMGAPWALLRLLARFPVIGGAHVGGVWELAQTLGLTAKQTVLWALARKLRYHPDIPDSLSKGVKVFEGASAWRRAFGDHAPLLMLLGYRSLPKAKAAYAQMSVTPEGSAVSPEEFEAGVQTLLLLQRGLVLPSAQDLAVVDDLLRRAVPSKSRTG